VNFFRRKKPTRIPKKRATIRPLNNRIKGDNAFIFYTSVPRWPHLGAIRARLSSSEIGKEKQGCSVGRLKDCPAVQGCNASKGFLFII
jgi:hypothetical protein